MGQRLEPMAAQQTKEEMIPQHQIVSMMVQVHKLMVAS
jgi:hypothetical protein